MEDIKLTIDGKEFKFTKAIRYKGFTNDPVLYYNSKEYYGEVVLNEPDWEIVSYTDKYGFIRTDKAVFYIMEEEIRKYPNSFKIHSVKRLSDGEVFTVGDKVQLFTKGYTNVAAFSIKDFYTSGKDLFVNKTNGCWNVMSLEKIEQKKPLFTTEDGVDVYEGDKFYIVDRFTIINMIAPSSKPGNETYCKSTYSNIEAAKEYILHNKPVEVSYKELSEIIYNNWDALENAKATAKRIRDAIKEHFRNKTTK